MAAIMRYLFPNVEPYDLEPDDFARIWREAQFVVKTFQLITRHE